MTLIQEATAMMEKMPIKSQQVVVDLLRMINVTSISAESDETTASQFKRTGKSNFNLPADFDDHFNDMDEEIASMFYGEGNEIFT
ncbi:MAG: hypothetical protein IJU50_02245 [Lachnospiraceae bacterium]|nr:hypothetical protein [Lachnospiraceae bacterium]